jgi:hypothetical protein
VVKLLRESGSWLLWSLVGLAVTLFGIAVFFMQARITSGGH